MVQKITITNWNGTKLIIKNRIFGSCCFNIQIKRIQYLTHVVHFFLPKKTIQIKEGVID